MTTKANSATHSSENSSAISMTETSEQIKGRHDMKAVIESGSKVASSTDDTDTTTLEDISFQDNAQSTSSLKGFDVDSGPPALDEMGFYPSQEHKHTTNNGAQLSSHVASTDELFWKKIDAGPNYSQHESVILLSSPNDALCMPAQKPILSTPPSSEPCVTETIDSVGYVAEMRSPIKNKKNKNRNKKKAKSAMIAEPSVSSRIAIAQTAIGLPGSGPTTVDSSDPFCDQLHQIDKIKRKMKDEDGPNSSQITTEEDSYTGQAEKNDGHII